MVRIGTLLVLVLLAATAWAAVDPAPQAPAPEQLVTLVRIHLPLTGSADLTLQTTIRRIRDQLLAQARAQKIERRPVLVLQLEGAGGQPVGDSQFERALAVAEFLSSREMAGVRTVAFLPRSLSGHGVLLALACEEIVMGPEATIGQANAEEPGGEPIRQTVVSAYREVAETQRTIPTALALGMIDPALEVLQVESESGTHFLLTDELEQFANQQDIISEKVLVPAGTVAEFDGREGRRFGFVKYLASNRKSLASALGVDEDDLREDESLADSWRPVVIDLSGEITPQVATRIDSLLGQALDQQVNWICLRIDSSGGDLTAGLRIASSLARIDANSVRTVAYVPDEASGIAAVVALSCDQLAMSPDAKLAAISARQLGDREGGRKLPVPDGAKAEPPPDLAAAEETIRTSLAGRVERPWSLLAAMINPQIHLAEYQNNQTAETRVMSANEVAALPDAANWQQRAAVGDDNERLSLSGTQAHEKGIAWRSVETIDELAQQFGLRGELPNLKPNPALELIEALAAPELAIILLMVGFAGIYIELKTPGVGVGGFVGAVALLLFFWSKYLDGTAGWLEALLFLAGFLFLMLEVFVLPGFGIFGLGGGAMMIASLVLASLTFVTPHSQAEVDQLARSVGTVALAGVGVMVFALATRRYLPQAPLFRSIVLEPPEDDERDELQRREVLFDSSSLLGKEGVAFTDLRPTGKAMIDHELVDVVAEAEPLDRGTPIVVAEAHGGRIVVRAASQG